MLRKKAYDANPENPDVQFWLGVDYFWSNEPEEAMTLWQKCVAVRRECTSGYAFVGKELAMDSEILQVLRSFASSPETEQIIGYVTEEPQNPLLMFWTTNTMETEDRFWLQLVQRRDDWIAGNEEPSSQWYLGWKAQSTLRARNHKHAYQWGLSTVQTFPNYTNMYAVLAEAAKYIRKDTRPFWTQYLRMDPKTSRIDEAKKAVEG